MTHGITLTPAELAELTGYRQPERQLAELHRQGFHRARKGPAGGIILEREHYLAVCRGQAEPTRPRVRAPVVRVAA